MKFVTLLLTVAMMGCLKPIPVAPEPPHVIVVAQVPEQPPLVIVPEEDAGPPIHTWMSEEEVAAWKKARDEQESKCMCQQGDPICSCLDEDNE